MCVCVCVCMCAHVCACRVIDGVMTQPGGSISHPTPQDCVPFLPSSLTLHPLTNVHEHPQHQGMLVLKESHICLLQSRQGLLQEEGEGRGGEERRGGVSGSDCGELVVVKVIVMV